MPAPAFESFVHPPLKQILSLLIAASFTAAAHAEKPEPGKTVRLLTVGNSFSHNATHYLGNLAKAAGDTLVLREDNVGGASFEVHWKKVQAFEKDPKDKLGLYTEGKSLKTDLTSGHWDVVTFQQASILSHNLNTYRPCARQLSDYIRRTAPDAKLLLHETWEYRMDDSRFSAKAPNPGEPKTQEEMYRGLSAAYATIAKELDVQRMPVGDAFHIANRDPKWGFKPSTKPFDSKTAKPGELPDQTHSLNVGWNWKKKGDKNTLGMDGHHAGMAGEYLGACVWYEVLFGKSVENNSFVPEGLEAEYAKFLRATAHRAVAEGK